MEKENKYKYALLGLLVIAIIGSFIIIITETNFFYKKAGSSWDKTLDISEIVGEEVGGGFIQLTRNDLTPSALELATFDNDKQIAYFSIAKDEKVEKNIHINAPTGMTKGDYYIDIRIYINGNIYPDTYKFTIR